MCRSSLEYGSTTSPTRSHRQPRWALVKPRLTGASGSPFDVNRHASEGVPYGPSGLEDQAEEDDNVDRRVVLGDIDSGL